MNTDNIHKTYVIVLTPPQALTLYGIMDECIIENSEMLMDSTNDDMKTNCKEEIRTSRFIIRQLQVQG